MRTQQKHRHARNPYTLVARQRTGGVFHDRRAERGGTSNELREHLDDWLSEQRSDEELDGSDE